MHTPLVIGKTNNYTSPYIITFDNLNFTDHKFKQPKRYRNCTRLNPKLNASASAQPNVNDLKYIINIAKQYTENNNPKQIFIIDLRQEPHAMLNGYAISWYGFRNQAPNHLEPELINNLLQQKDANIKVYKKLNKLADGHFTPTKLALIKLKTITAEKAVVEELGANYVRFLVTDHFAPNDSHIDEFIQFIKKLPSNSVWLHFHCRGGKGRATTFLAMYDIIQNAHHVTLDQIIHRQHELGGIKLSNIMFKISRKKWKEQAAKERYSLLKNFYNYVTAPNGYTKISWRDWLKQHPIVDD